MTRLYVFDFDGVLFDTARECLQVAFGAIRSLPARWTFADAWRELAAPPADLTATFAKHRYLVGPPWQYAVLLKCIADGNVPTETAAFLELASSLRGELESFTEAYFASRGELAKDEARWLALATPYEPSLRKFRELHAAGSAVILSTRDDRSITKICGNHGIALTPEHLLPRAGPREKWEILLDAAAARELAPGDVVFLDDYVHHALPAHRRGIRAHLATWGYLGPRDASDALTAGLPCLQLADLQELT